MRPRVGINLFRLAIVSGAVLATVPLTTVAFAWTQPICNPNTGEVLQPSHFADEAAYSKYLKDHPGSYEMQAGGKCSAPVAQEQQVSLPTVTYNAPVTTSDTLSTPAKPVGTVICVVNVNDLGTTVEQRRVVDVTRFLSTHAGSFIMASGKDCGPTFMPNLPTTTNQSNSANQSTTANTLVTSPGPASVGDTTASAPVTTAGTSNAVTAAAPMVESAGASPAFAAAPLEVAGVAVAGFGAAELDLLGEFQIVPSIPPFAGDGTTADEIVP
jgi:hypothetical protein